MNRIHFNCASGASGDMIVGSLLDTGIDPSCLVRELDKLGLAGYSINTRKVNKKGVDATKFDVHVKNTQPERHLPEIYGIMDRSALEERVKDLGKKIFLELAASEAAAHDKTIDEVHFHEVGAVDSIIDVMSASILLTKLDIKEVRCSTIALGCGQTMTSHGLMDVPVPAVRHLLNGKPTRKTSIRTELTTPTGAAIMKTITKRYTDDIPETERKGFGAGTKDLEKPNVLEARIF